MQLNVVIDLREARVGDADGVVTCLAEAFEPYREQYTPDGFRDTIVGPEGIAKRMSEMTVLVIATHVKGSTVERILGTISYATEAAPSTDGHIRGMAVRSEYLGTYLARTLLSTAEEALRKAGCTRVTLDTTEPLQRAQRFYEKNGYQPTGRESDFYGMRLIELGKSL